MITYNIFLTGFMGTGKSTVAAAFSEKYGTEIVEMDETISKRAAMTIPAIFEKYGEEYFRGLETEFLKEISEEKNRIVSCGGGVVLKEENVLLMKKCGVTVLLTASPESVLERVKNDYNRPLLKNRKTVKDIAELMEKRREKYEAAADIIVSTEGKYVAEICEEIKKKLDKMEEE